MKVYGGLVLRSRVMCPFCASPPSLSWMEAGVSYAEVRTHLQAEARHHRCVIGETGIAEAAQQLLGEMRQHQEESQKQVSD